LNVRAAALLKTGKPAVLCGDFNAVPTPLDAYKPERWLGDEVFFPETRALYGKLLAQGWTDALRALHPGEAIYTYWDYFRNAFARNAGLRMDHLLLSAPLAKRLRAAGVDRAVRSWEKTSDHAPVWVELAAATAPKRVRRVSVAKENGSMATNPPSGDGHRNGAVRKRTQLKTKIEGEEHWTKRSKGTGQFVDQKKEDAKFKGVRREKAHTR
jgi:exodeoxyribonuclease-3